MNANDFAHIFDNSDGTAWSDNIRAEHEILRVDASHDWREICHSLRAATSKWSKLSGPPTGPHSTRVALKHVSDYLAAVESANRNKPTGRPIDRQAAAKLFQLSSAALATCENIMLERESTRLAEEASELARAFSRFWIHRGSNDFDQIDVDNQWRFRNSALDIQKELLSATTCLLYVGQVSAPGNDFLTDNERDLKTVKEYFDQFVSIVRSDQPGFEQPSAAPRPNFSSGTMRELLRVVTRALSVLAPGDSEMQLVSFGYKGPSTGEFDTTRSSGPNRPVSTTASTLISGWTLRPPSASPSESGEVTPRASPYRQ